LSSVVAAPAATLMHDAMRLRDALGLSSREARSEVELLLMRALGVTRARLIAHPELAAEAAENRSYRESLERRMSGEPMAYILAEREFYSEVFTVSPAVLIPRPETELLVDLALERIDTQRHCRVLDLGTGSGAIAIAIALHRPHVDVVAVDMSESALEVAVFNAGRLLEDTQRVQFVRSDWFRALKGTRFDLIVSNPPYVAEGDAHLAGSDLRFEPKQALVAGQEGLDDLRRIVGEAPAYLSEGGWLLFEHGYDQAQACRTLLEQAGFAELVAERDLAGILRVSGGRWLTAGPVAG
jgi:release factor glutamine methyltransferase